MQKKASKKSSPATSRDIALLMNSIGKLYDANERWKDDIKHHFDVVIENAKHDFLDATKDKIENHEDRLIRLEKQVA